MSTEENPKIIDLINEQLKDAFDSSGVNVKPFKSLEFFPPRTAAGVKNLDARLDRMKAAKPLFVDYTWGAGGSTAELTLDLTIGAKENHGQVPNMHLTCTNMPAEKVDHALELCKSKGVRNIVALRGDPPAGSDTWEATHGGFSCALDLVRHIRAKHGDYFGISVAGYPEGHPDNIKEAPGGLESLSEAEKGRCKVQVGEDGKEVVYVCSDEDFVKEMVYLKEKVDAGADFIITQMFFDNQVYAAFKTACENSGINVPVVPGLMCINAYGGFKKMTGFCRTRVPAELDAKMESLKDDEQAIKAFGVEYGVQTCKELLQLGAPGLHFYTLNLEKVTMGIITELGLQDEYEVAAKEEDTAQMIGMIKSGPKEVTTSTENGGGGIAPVVLPPPPPAAAQQATVANDA